MFPIWNGTWVGESLLFLFHFKWRQASVLIIIFEKETNLIYYKIWDKDQTVVHLTERVYFPMMTSDTENLLSSHIVKIPSDLSVDSIKSQPMSFELHRALIKELSIVSCFVTWIRTTAGLVGFSTLFKANCFDLWYDFHAFTYSDFSLDKINFASRNK